MKKLLILLFVINCASTEDAIKYEPSPTVGCSGIENVKDRLKCIGRLVQELENIKNAKVVVEVQKLDRID